MIAMTTSSSMSVKPRRREFDSESWCIGQNLAVSLSGPVSNAITQSSTDRVSPFAKLTGVFRYRRHERTAREYYQDITINSELAQYSSRPHQ
jgi:hypothetical protein